MTLLTALSPLDNRYRNSVSELEEYFSEYALLKYRVMVEIRWFLFLSNRQDIPDFPACTQEEERFLEAIVSTFSERDAERIREIEKTTNHDVKAVEYFLKEKIRETSLEGNSEWIHFACTSEDINNLSYALMLRDGVKNAVIPAIRTLEEIFKKNTEEWKSLPLLARTHGQSASPTTMGKEWLIFLTRLRRQLKGLEQQEFLGKMNGATGNFNAHVSAFPDADWLDISERFVQSLGLAWQGVSSQIECHDFIAEISHAMSRINTILIDFSRDIWGYVSLHYFTQKLKDGEIGSSTMPHKVNPIDFENAEGNLGYANALWQFFAEKLPVSRWQRDLTDSTVLRNIGVAFGHSLLAYKSLLKGIGKLQIHPEKMEEDLNENIEVLAEAVQTVLRKYGVEKPYEKLKELTRGKRITIEGYQAFVENLDIPEEPKQYLRELTPGSYIGMAPRIVERFL